MSSNKPKEVLSDENKLIAIVHQLTTADTLLQLLIMECTDIGLKNLAQALVHHYAMLQPVFNGLKDVSHNRLITLMMDQQNDITNQQEKLLLQKGS